MPSKRSKVSICECGRPQEDTLKFYSCVNLKCPCLQNTSNHTLRLGSFLLFYWRVTSTYLDILNKQLLNKENTIPAMSELNSSLTGYKPEQSSQKLHLSRHSVAQIYTRIDQTHYCIATFQICSISPYDKLTKPQTDDYHHEHLICKP